MGIEVWHIWIIAAVILFIVEIFAPTFISICIAIGCLASGLFSYFDYGIKIQTIIFFIGTSASFFGVRPLMLKYAYKEGRGIKTNVDALIGKIGRVTIKIDPNKDEGRVIVDGEDWRAISEGNIIINSGEKIEVIKVDSTILIVKSIKKGE